LPYAGEVCRSNHLEFNVAADAKAMAGPDQLPKSWQELRKEIPSLSDALASPSGKLVAFVTASGIDARLDGKSVGKTEVRGAVVVMAQWAIGAENVARWSTEAAKTLAK
jgi:hypothetical protein